ncbi:hypothetical protein Sjap_003534 [Stephania japonica]|uniref:Bulb-type lectin domain-containing protein n=1 Tax=Stephania japonica TaxID=461633 RepID=A0AAP0PVJ8_9MAGN
MERHEDFMKSARECCCALPPDDDEITKSVIRIRKDVETKGNLIRSLFEKIRAAVFTYIEDVLYLVDWLDNELSSSADENDVLKHFNGPQTKADVMREATIEYRGLKRLASEEAGSKRILPVVDVSKGVGLLNEVKPANKDIIDLFTKNMVSEHLGAICNAHLGDSSKARRVLGWKPRVGFQELVKMMVEKDVELAKREKRRLQNNFDKNSNRSESNSIKNEKNREIETKKEEKEEKEIKRRRARRVGLTGSESLSATEKSKRRRRRRKKKRSRGGERGIVKSISTATSAGDTMFAGQSLTASQTLVSKEGRFELGFFTPGNSQNYYIGIWYKQVALVQKKKTIIWVANRNKPISITDLSSSEFKLLGNGHLVLLVRARRNASYSKIPIWTSSTDSTTSKSMNDSLVKALLGDNANLVITSSGNGNIIWQSFDHLTNAYLPGAKNGYYNKLTKKSRKISSWRNSEDPSDGIYSAQLDPDNSFSFLWNQSQKYYNSGVWKGRYFDNNPEMELENAHILHNFTSNKKESYFSYFLTNESVPLVNFMDLSGQMATIIWMPETKDWTVIWSKPMLRCQVTNSAIQKTGACLITPVGA